MIPATDNRKRKIPRRLQRKYVWLLGLAAVQTLFWVVFSRLLLQGNLPVENDYYRHSGSNNRFHSISITNKSLGEQIVENAYRNSGYEDFATIVCPPKNNTAMLPSRIQKDFVDDCLAKAHKIGCTPGNIYHDRWPWWFRTLIRDLGRFDKGKFPDLAGPWHYLQFKGVGNPTAVGQANDAAPRLQLCVYEKGGSKSWKKLQCEHNHDYTGEIPNLNRCWTRQPPYDEQMSVGTDPNNRTAAAYKSEKAVFLRDPLERFLSGFLDKCVRRWDPYNHCEPSVLFAKPNPNNINNSNSDIAMNSPIKNMLWDNRRTFQAYVDTFPLRWNMHFFPQSFYCGGLYKTIGDYDFVGNMGENFYIDLDAMQKSYPGLGTGMERVFKLSQKLSSGIFRSAKDKSKNIGVETEAASQALDYYTPHTVRRVLEYYAIDYVSLGLPIPEWAEEMLLQQ
eukprot:CAMPEP_0116128892 /NCGR_PEP_ID=MMETSP0329-20121206/7630_1 /TAXON_ID=697910 /ORGANISM="Pseudo-nitzschia arenysensis, Strain B593" /LENGTH=447 /DNA_ID=CAMNT_0003623117 /DNA_START=136 /DNA_END=1479 /DNA_ORIENTATION=-